MNIIIVGAGKVGSTLAAHLLSEGHDITIIDQNERVLTQISNTLDVIAYIGNGAAYASLSDANVEKCDLLIATTASDETNILCCLTAKKLGVKNTVARVRNPEYYERSGFLQEGLGLSMVINPELATAQEIARILRFPSANRAEMFAGGRAEMIACRVKKDSPFEGTALCNLPSKTGVKLLVCAVERNGEALIPSGDFVPKENDILFVVGSPYELVANFKKLKLSTMRAKSVIIIGGSKIAFYLAETLGKDGVSVKIIEKNPDRAKEIGNALSHATVIIGDLANHELLLEESLEKTDAFVALTGLDESNILGAIYASHKNVKKVIAKVNNLDLIQLINENALETTISPRLITINHIIRYVRALCAGGEGGDVQAIYRLMGSKVELLEFKADSKGEYLDIPFMDLSIKKNVLIACIIRKGKVIIPDGHSEIHYGDGVLAVTSGQRLQSLSDILE